MPRTYEHLNRTEREYLGLRRQQGASCRDIGRELGRDPGTVSRELRRNRNGQERYYSGHAHRLALSRRRLPRRKPRLKEGRLRRAVEQGLKKYWSPEQIEGRRRYLGKAGVSRMTIYRHIEKNPEYAAYLRGPDGERRRRRQKRERIHGRKLIDQRPREVEERRRIGDWESDTVQGARSSRVCMATHVERKSYYLVCRLLKEKNSQQMNQETAKGMRGLPVHTLTVDNGMEFGSFKKLEKKLGARVYFAHEKKPWQRARVELTNRLLRQFFPRRTDLGGVSPAQLRRAEELLNNRPRKALGYKTPKEVMHAHRVALAS